MCPQGNIECQGKFQQYCLGEVPKASLHMIQCPKLCRERYGHCLQRWSQGCIRASNELVERVGQMWCRGLKILDERQSRKQHRDKAWIQCADIAVNNSDGDRSNEDSDYGEEEFWYNSCIFEGVAWWSCLVDVNKLDCTHLLSIIHILECEIDT